MRAASISASGTQSSACRTRKVPKALTANGRTKPRSVLTKPSRANSVKIGTNAHLGRDQQRGHDNPRAQRLPRKCSLAKA